MMKDNKYLTLIIMFHNDLSKVDFFSDLLKGSTDDVDVVFNFDGNRNLIDKNIVKKLELFGFSVNVNKTNLGKLMSIIKCSQTINTNFIKIVDSDDSIYLNELKRLNNELSKIDPDTLVRHSGCKIYLNNKTKGIFDSINDPLIIDKQIKYSKSPIFPQQTNYDTIYPTKIVKLLSFVNISRQEFHNDILLSNFVLGMTNKITNIKSKIYIQFHSKGQTSNYDIRRALCIKELYENYLKIKETYPIFNFRILM